MSKAYRILNALDVQAERKLMKLALDRARNPNRYKVEGKGFRTRYFKKLASAAKFYHKLKVASARPRMTSLLFNCSVWTSLQAYDIPKRKKIAPVKRLAAPSPVPSMLYKPKVIEPYTLEDWARTFVGVRAG